MRKNPYLEELYEAAYPGEEEEVTEPVPDEEPLSAGTTRNELIVGIFLFAVLFMAGNFFVEDKLAYTLGIWFGSVVAMLLAIHMHHTFEESILYDEVTARKKVSASVGTRMFFMIAALITAALLPQYLSVIGVMIGILNLKFSAYLQPITHKASKKIKNKGGRESGTRECLSNGSAGSDR